MSLPELSSPGRPPVTGMRRTVPQPQPSSGWGHSSWRPQDGQRTVIQSWSQTRWVTAVAAAPRSSGGAIAAPHAQGYDGAV
jgi:hypothetical protein